MTFDFDGEKGDFILAKPKHVINHEDIVFDISL